MSAIIFNNLMKVTNRYDLQTKVPNSFIIGYKKLLDIFFLYQNFAIAILLSLDYMRIGLCIGVGVRH